VVDNQHRKISGYRDLTDTELGYVNMIKGLEREVGEAWKQVREDVGGADQRWLSVARTHLQEGFTALVRAVARPDETFWGANKDWT
jgi:hypothetical protein